jgi:transcriptional regulator with XRE-family HTH domain
MDKQTEFAEFLGVSQYQLSRWENQLGQPSTENIYRIWKRLKIIFPNINLQDLLDDDAP